MLFGTSVRLLGAGRRCRQAGREAGVPREARGEAYTYCAVPRGVGEGYSTLPLSHLSPEDKETKEPKDLSKLKDLKLKDLKLKTTLFLFLSRILGFSDSRILGFSGQMKKGQERSLRLRQEPSPGLTLTRSPLVLSDLSVLLS